MYKNAVPYWRYGAVLIALLLMIFGARSFASEVKAWATPESVTVIPAPTLVSPPDPDKPLTIKDKVQKVTCGPDGQVSKALIDVEISGGVPPYKVDFDPGNQTISNLSESILEFTLEGGKSTTISVRSDTPDGRPMDSKDVSAPSHDPRCEDPASTFTRTPTATPTPTHTPTATRQRITFTPTPTKDKDDPDHLTGTPTNTPAVPPTGTPSDPTNTPRDPTSTPSNPTSTPRDPTSTPRDPTNTPSNPTSTPSNPTSTPVIAPTSTPTRKPTSTPTTDQNLAECEDGRDNDGDGKIDMQDGQCTKHSDNHEDK